jgi:hypothetical protein
MFSRKGAASRIAAFIKGSFLNNLDAVIRRNAAKANLFLKTVVADEVFRKKTPGAFGSAREPTRFKPGTGQPGMWKYCQARGKVRGY